MSKTYLRFLVILLTIAFCAGCSTYQPVKNVWKSTKGLWNTYVSPPASVDYEDKGDVPPQAIALSSSMMGVDSQLSKLERTMQNADKPPTQQWLDGLFASFPWLSGFAGVKYDGTILGQQPPESLKELDFNPLLYEDKRQNSRALRADVQPSPLGPEIMLATPLYDGIDFLGIVVAYFDMRSLMKYSDNAQDIVVLCPTALLWPGKYDFAATPLAGVDWSKVVAESSAGSCTNSNGKFFYQVRYLGNLPLIFAIPEKGDFPEGNGDIGQGFAFFPTSREKLPPPPAPERKPVRENAVAAFAKSDETDIEPAMEEAAQEDSTPAERTPRSGSRQSSPNDIQPGSRESVLLNGGGSRQGGHVQERDLEGENVPVERVPRRTRPARQPVQEPSIELIPESEMAPPMPMQRPSPFGPRTGEDSAQQQYRRPSPFGPRSDDAAKQDAQPADTSPASAEPLADGEIPADADNTASGASASPAASEKPAPSENTQSGTVAEPLADGETPPSSNTASSPEADKAATASEPAPVDEAQKPALLPGGRPSPFGPRK